MKSNFIKRITIAVSVVLFLGLTTPQSCFAQTEEKRLVAPVWEGKVSEWNGFNKTDFKFENRDAYVVSPKTPAPGNPWVWRARFPGFHAEADLILLAPGFSIVFNFSSPSDCFATNLGTSSIMDVIVCFHLFEMKI